ncbi:addiction module protein [Lacunimicrobium album]
MDKAELYQQVSALTTEERSELLSFLIRSLDEEPAVDQDEVDQAWGEEIKRRVESVRNGTAELIPSEEVWKLIDADE